MLNVNIRELKKLDLTNGFAESLSALRDITTLNESTKIEIFDRIQKRAGHYIHVAEYKNQVIGTGTLIIEPKFIHNGGKAGHVEDVAIRREFQRQGVGTQIMNSLKQKAKDEKCYKMVVVCDTDVSKFYTKLNYHKNSIYMRIDL